MGILVGNVPEIDGVLSVFNFIFVNFVLFVFCSVFYKKKMVFVKDDGSFINRIWFLLIISVALLIVTLTNIFIVFNSISFVFSGGLDITEFKNQGGAAEMIRTWVDPRLVFFSYGFSPLAYIALALHFYFLLKRKLFLSVIFLVFALNIPLVGLHALSRSSIVHFILLYFLVYFFCYHGIQADLKRRINYFIVVAFGFIFIIFYLITVSRFGESSYYDRAESSLITNRAFYSVFDYASQWIVYSNVALDRYSVNDTWFGKSTFTVIDVIKGMIGLEVESYTVVRQEVLGEYSSRFIGLIATLIYDFSHLGTIYYIFIYWFSFKVMVRQNISFSIQSILIIIVFVAQPLMFFSNNYLGNTMYAIGSFYSLMIYAFSKVSFRARASCV